MIVWWRKKRWDVPDTLVDGDPEYQEALARYRQAQIVEERLRLELKTIWQRIVEKYLKLRN